MAENKIELVNEHPISSDDVLYLIKSTDLGENFDYESDFNFIGRINGRLIGIIIYRLQNIDNGDNIPRFIHIIISKEFRKTKDGIILLDMTENFLKEHGYKNVIAYIKYNNKFMKKLAIKYFYKKYNEDNEGEYFVKYL